jgi:predicted Fe-S protein YdhL (DUF1289 family)
MTALVSPCINVCVLDPVSGLCRGCGRTLDEIAQWTQLDPAERARITLEAPQRLSALPARPAQA